MANNYLAWMRLPNMPDNPDKLIFSVDLIHCVMATRWPEYANLGRNVNDLERFRDDVYNAFTDDIKDAIIHLTNEMADDIENRFSVYLQNNEEINESSFTRMAEDLFKEFSANGTSELNLRSLMRYWVALGLLAGHYYSHNMTQARTLASNFVQCSLPAPRFEDSTYWDKLTVASRIILGYEEEVRPEDPPNLNAAEYQEHPSPRNIPDEPFK